MPDFKKISIEKIPSFYNPEQTFAYVTSDKKYDRTTLVLYISVNPGHEIDFANIETLTTYDISDTNKKDEKVLRNMYKDMSKEDLDEFKEKIQLKYKDWRKLKFKSTFTFQAKKIHGRPAYMQYYKFNLAGTDHEIVGFDARIVPSTLT